jgi:hypothetical protein
MKYRCTPLELYNRDRTSVTGYGVEWNEPRLFVEALLRFFAKAIFLLAALLAYCAFVFGIDRGGGASVPLVLGAAASVALGVFMIKLAKNGRGKPQSMEFSKDGRIYVSWEGEWKIPVSGIRSVEVEQLSQPRQDALQNYTHGVRMVTRRGRVLHVARNVEPDHAIMISVMLNDAIEAVRYADQRPAPAKMNGVPAEVW